MAQNDSTKLLESMSHGAQNEGFYEIRCKFDLAGGVSSALKIAAKRGIVTLVPSACAPGPLREGSRPF